MLAVVGAAKETADRGVGAGVADMAEATSETTSTGITAGTGMLLVSQDDIEDVEELRRLSTSAAGSSVFFSISGDGVRKIRGGIELRR